jgi:lipoprotein-anchoring transpeptidase ErfK/SrfK
MRRLPFLIAAGSIALVAAAAAALIAGTLRAGLEDAGSRPGHATEASPAGQLVAALTRPSATRAPLRPYETLVAQAPDERQAMVVHRLPGSQRGLRTVRKEPGQRAPLVFTVIARRGGWLKVRLPIRPNGSTGWIREREVRLARTDWRVRVELRRHRVTVWQGRRVYGRWPIGLGQPWTPTPTGRFYVTQLIKPPTDDTIYGAYVFVLSGFSDKLTSYGGGDGELGLHGTNDPSGLGRDVSHGCIRMSNRAITRLAQRLPLGTPVTIVASSPPQGRTR